MKQTAILKAIGKSSQTVSVVTTTKELYDKVLREGVTIKRSQMLTNNTDIDATLDLQKIAEANEFATVTEMTTAFNAGFDVQIPFRNGVIVADYLLNQNKK